MSLIIYAPTAKYQVSGKDWGPGNRASARPNQHASDSKDSNKRGKLVSLSPSLSYAWNLSCFLPTGYVSKWGTQKSYDLPFLSASSKVCNTANSVSRRKSALAPVEFFGRDSPETVLHGQAPFTLGCQYTIRAEHASSTFCTAEPLICHTSRCSCFDATSPSQGSRFAM